MHAERVELDIHSGVSVGKFMRITPRNAPVVLGDCGAQSVAAGDASPAERQQRLGSSRPS
jgi:hypothetical protein